MFDILCFDFLFFGLVYEHLLSVWVSFVKINMKMNVGGGSREKITHLGKKLRSMWYLMWHITQSFNVSNVFWCQRLMWPTFYNGLVDFTYFLSLGTNLTGAHTFRRKHDYSLFSQLISTQVWEDSKNKWVDLHSFSHLFPLSSPPNEIVFFSFTQIHSPSHIVLFTNTLQPNER